MKDKQSSAKIPTGSIPVISPVLHCLAMPVLVCLRHGFGYLYLSPKSVFLASIFAIVLLDYAVWHDASLKARFLALSLFLSTAALLYLFHLIRSIFKQKQGIAEHDLDSGTSHLLAFLSPAKRAKLEVFVQAVIEPALAFGVGSFLEPNPLSFVLKLSGVALAFKEIIRWWLSIRMRKRNEDNLSDAEETMGDLHSDDLRKPPPKSGKTAREFLPRRFEED